ncbi:hypothetical protein WR25_26567 isoform B [Diploscapter pachys]|uniref:SET domain-containing protein n=1 Tax=Diploscapter pachys TaxID=2018661 RepID=A0A2A2LSH5_9BILA|nr:hypothetical protein WR25_26567 isoform B [Diploscapter pachys]
MVDIPKGAFIANYHGALLTTDLADQLQCDVYFADLDLKDSVEKCKVDEDCAMGFLDEAIGSSEGEQEDRPAQRRRKGSDDDDGVGSDLSDDQESTGQMRLRRKRKGTKRNYADDAGESDSSENAEQPKTTTRKIDNEDAIFLWDSYFTESESLFVLDAKDKGNIGRFYNHCCDPNIQTQHVLVDTHDLRLPWISFFACRNIKAGEELRWNYNYFKGESADADVEERLPCNCGAPSCDGVFRYTYQHSKNDAPEATDETQYPRRTNQVGTL